MKSLRLLISRLLALTALFSLTGCHEQPPAPDPTELEASELIDLLSNGGLDAVTVTRAHIERIRALDRQGPDLHAVLELNPDALTDAAALDEAFFRSGPQGPLHGVPVLIKGNIDVAGLTTSAGSLALAEYPATVDAELVARLRASGAVILGTANLSEWANFRDSKSTSGWSSVGGQVKNPYVLDRNPCGSSSGSAVAVAARLAPLAVGTETNGSIICPAGTNGVVGIKPTVGLVSRAGIIPISHTQDTAGPIARSVTAAALLLEIIMLEAMIDDNDPAAAANSASMQPDPDLTHLQGRRIGILRTYQGAGHQPQTEAIYEQAIKRLAVLGAELVDPIEYRATPAQRGAAYRILLREFKAGLDDYLAARDLPEDRGSLVDLIEFNRANRNQVMPIFGQSIFLEAAAMTGLGDPAYESDLQLAQKTLRTDIQNIFEVHRLDALFMPATGPAWKTDWINGDSASFGSTAYLAAISGYPGIVLPAGVVDHLPVAVGFMGLKGTDAQVIQIAYALEQSLPRRTEPRFLATLEEPTLEESVIPVSSAPP